MKFVLVVMFYMHLKYDSKIFTGIFLFPFALATLVIVGLTILYHVLHPLRSEPLEDGRANGGTAVLAGPRSHHPRPPS